MRSHEPHEVARLEVVFRFLYFVRDLGIKSAHDPAVAAWAEYTAMQVHLATTAATS